jgi:ribonucleoside-diphosphate reductase alpha chain
VKSPYLEEALVKYNKNTAEVWSSIITNKGSVQHLSFLNEHEKAVFKTADELDQRWVVKHAADRQKYICQGQSVNLFFPAGSDRAYVMQTHILAWQLGLKGLYYLRTEAKSRAENVSEKVERVALEDYKGTIVYGTNTCPFCEMAKQELDMRGIPYEFVNLKEIGKTAKEVTGRDVKTVPQIYLGGDYVGGYDDLMIRLDAADSAVLDSGECRSCEG